MTSMKKGPCLVAQSAPCPLAYSADEMVARLEQLTMEDNSEKVIEKDTHNISPSDYVTLQSIRSSALARKTNTTSKISRMGSALFSDLLNKEDKNKTEKKKTSTEDGDKETSTENDEESGKEGELLPRGPVRNIRPIGQPHHPYVNGCERGIQYGAAALSTVQDYTAFSNFGGGYECGNTWGDSPDNMGYMSQSSTPDTMLSDQGYASASPTLTSPGPPPFTESFISSQELGRLLESTELPEQLADFILKFSRQYTVTAKDEAASPKTRPPSADSGVDSPMSARSAPGHSPEVPQGGHSGPTTPFFSQTRLSPRKFNERVAKQKLKAVIPEGQLEASWAWVLMFQKEAPQALFWQDADRDSLLHIVTARMDLGKIYSIVEHHLKLDYSGNHKPFDQLNKYHETPLHLAVMNKSTEVVAYLLEIGADPNNQSMRGDRDSVLHHAAGRGMTEITELLCLEHGTNLNVLNARGQTPLHVAIRNHGAVEEHTNRTIDNKEVIKTLLANGADPTCIDNTNGKTIVHFAVERMNPDLVDLLRRQINEDIMTQLVNQADFNGDKPMKLLEQTACTDSTKMSMILPMLTCGAEMK